MLRDGTTTTLVSAGTGGRQRQRLHAPVLPGDAGRLSCPLRTNEALVADDTDTRNDLYEYTARERAARVDRAGGGNGAFDLESSQVYITEDGDKVIFMTSEKLVSADTGHARRLRTCARAERRPR